MQWSRLGVAVLFAAAIGAAGSCDTSLSEPVGEAEQALFPCLQDPVLEGAAETILEGRQVFRFDTFGDEAFWGDTLRLHEAIAGAANGGVGPGISPNTALGLGLKVDVTALPAQLRAKLRQGRVDLDDPATTLALLELNAVVGLTGFFNAPGTIVSVGIQCALCHSTVDDSFAAGIGLRRDGWPNRALNVGAIIAAAPDLEPIRALLAIANPGITVQQVRDALNAWGPGKFDAELLLDGQAFRPDLKTAATLIPAAFGLAGINLHTYTGWGTVSHWNAFVANIEMQGQGIFFDPRLDDATKFPIAQAAGFSNIRLAQGVPDRITPKLAALHFYQLALQPPEAPPDTFDPVAAARGKDLFNGKADCARCHVPPLFTEPGWNMHTPAEIGIDDFQANRSPDERYRTTPLRGHIARTKGGFYHDGRFETLLDVVNQYDTLLALGLTPGEKNDLVEYLRSL